jgi:outer membrane protein insertion porin family
MNKILSLIILLLLSTASLAESFVIKDIRVEGLQRLAEGTVFNYIPYKIGDEISNNEAKNIIRALFKSKYFDDVRVDADDGILTINVSERPAISSIEFVGNKDIDSEDLAKSLRQIGFAEGQVFEQAILERVELELQRQYFSRGKYGVSIESNVSDLSQNRVAIIITMQEGIVATIGGINIVGNASYPEDDLLSELESTTGSILSIITRDNQYSRQKLSADLETLRSFYLDRGFVDFVVESTQVSITDDKRQMFITINISEGDRYQIKEVRLAGNLIVPEKELFDLVIIKKDAVFSRKQVTKSSEYLTNRLGNDGYAFANVNAVPKIDRENRSVTLTFYVDPGRRAYVRRINIEGNSKTRDEVVRRELRQQEASWISTNQVEVSRARIQRLGYFEDVNVETIPVAGTADQVDLDFTVIEQSSGSLSAGLGFSGSDGLILNANITQQNFLGSGKHISLGFNNSDTNTVYNIGYTNPFATVDGISQGYNAFFRETDSDDNDNNIASFNTDVWGGSTSFGIPISENNRISLSLGYENTELEIPENTTIRRYSDFVEREGEEFDSFSVGLGWSSNTRNHPVLPTRGKLQRLSASVAVPGGSLQFYKLSYEDRRYTPLNDKLTLAYGGRVAYGAAYGSTDEYPFFENFYAGGQGSVRGFASNTLGIKDDGQALGGNFLVTAGTELIFPIPFMKKPLKSFRFSGFVDVGNVYDENENFDAGLLRYSAGLSAIWISPFGPVSVSIAQPFNEQEEDETEIFQFAVGSSF